MLKFIYFVALFSYVVVLGTYLMKFEVSYRIVKVRPEIIETRSLSFQEYKALKRAETIRKAIINLTLIGSIVIALFSGILWYFKLFTPLIVPIIVVIISTLFALVLVIVNSIHFIPHSPIR